MNTVDVGGRRHYALPDGTLVPSVTTVLGEKLNKDGLIEWRARVGEEEAKKISTQAANRGTAIHTMAERYILNEENYLRDQMPVNVDTFKSLKPILDDHVDNILGIELPLYSKALNTAGRTDLVAEYDGRLSIIDFKTSRKLKKIEYIESYLLQATVYSMMFEWIYKISVPQIAILIAVDHEEPQKFVLDRAPYVNRVLEVFNPVI